MKNSLALTSWLKSVSLVGALALLSGCSSLDNSVTTVVQSVQSATTQVLDFTATDDIQVEQLAQEHYRISMVVDEALHDFDNRALRGAANQSCPKGYVFESRQALNNGTLLNRDCTSPTSCQHQLIWTIRCKELAEEPFAIFGKS